MSHVFLMQMLSQSTTTNAAKEANTEADTIPRAKRGSKPLPRDAEGNLIVRKRTTTQKTN